MGETVGHIAAQLRAVCAGIERIDQEIARLADSLPDYGLFSSLPGAGPVLAPRLLVAFGERRERFANAQGPGSEVIAWLLGDGHQPGLCWVFELAV